MDNILTVYRSLRRNQTDEHPQQKSYPQTYQIFSVAVTLAALLLVEQTILNAAQARLETETIASDHGLSRSRNSAPPIVRPIVSTARNGAFVQNYHPALACRLLLGMPQAGMLPSIIFPVSTIWNKNQQAKRIAVPRHHLLWWILEIHLLTVSSNLGHERVLSSGVGCSSWADSGGSLYQCYADNEAARYAV
ncbi:uncharacterized protein Z518_00277 [Rhinocladiella mackenziei CBS 650.93]|uniref:Uncharacterized protein n=1 Tax=Rhinocladiella mackenziei CBS 650.93 TaxID=1442369 RepID=A0A0D2HEV1_9EURO|nr:uncharacterized protein Z518_00277 [Rhinocladiella mackenziei CBS 650.93]KIX09198.1 hypothetical protein Z518_00277 [Rhinocladiella mackenziei CBS 650.93]